MLVAAALGVPLTNGVGVNVGVGVAVSVGVGVSVSVVGIGVLVSSKEAVATPPIGPSKGKLAAHFASGGPRSTSFGPKKSSLLSSHPLCLSFKILIPSTFGPSSQIPDWQYKAKACVF